MLHFGNHRAKAGPSPFLPPSSVSPSSHLHQLHYVGVVQLLEDGNFLVHLLNWAPGGDAAPGGWSGTSGRGATWKKHEPSQSQNKETPLQRGTVGRTILGWRGQSQKDWSG